MMTEDEAKSKWCQERDEATANLIGAHCMASDCMAWRWKNKPGGYVDYDDAKGRAAYNATGYCGKAGVP